jgi:hypothetical protein
MLRPSPGAVLRPVFAPFLGGRGPFSVEQVGLLETWFLETVSCNCWPLPAQHDRIPLARALVPESVTTPFVALGANHVGGTSQVSNPRGSLRQHCVRQAMSVAADGIDAWSDDLRPALAVSVRCQRAPQPFVWSKSADEILASLERFCVRVRKAAAGARHEISIPM